MNIEASNTYKYSSPRLSGSKRFVLPRLLKILDGLQLSADSKRIFDIGCGNGSTMEALSRHGYDVTGVDPSSDGIRIAQESYPHLRIEYGSAYDDLTAKFGKYPIVISLEVIEHLYAPRKLLENACNMLNDNGKLIISTPYHGYWKNLALAVTGKMDSHFTVLTDDMHIKFFSKKTIGIMLREFDFEIEGFWRVGRIPPLAGSMIVLARKV